jgi:PKD repeat protein
MVTALNPQITWNFDDGPNSIINNSFPSYTYQQAGSYNICLTINANGCIDTFCDSLTVDSLGIIGRYSQTGFSINVVSPEEITNNNPASGILPMQDAKQSKLRCYPNPAKELLTIVCHCGESRNLKILDEPLT